MALETLSLSSQLPYIVASLTGVLHHKSTLGDNQCSTNISVVLALEMFALYLCDLCEISPCRGHMLHDLSSF